MFIKSYSVLLLCSVVLLSSCAEAVYRDETVLFNQFLKESLHVSIAGDSVNYILISEYGCDGCIRNTINRGSLIDNVTFIISTKGYERFFGGIQSSRGRTLIDSTDGINRIPFHAGNVAIVQTANKSIYNIVKLEPDNADSLLKAYVH